MSRTEIFAWLLSLGPVIKESWADIMLIVEALKRIYARAKPADEGTLQVVADDELSVTEQSQVAEIQALLSPSEDGVEALFDIGGLLSVVKFLRENPELLAFLMGFFRKG